MSPLGVIGVDAKLGRKERCFHVFLLSLFPRRAMEAPEGLSARKGSLLEPQAVPGESQPLPANAVQITVVKAQDLVKRFWKCLCWVNNPDPRGSLCCHPILDQA